MFPWKGQIPSRTASRRYLPVSAFARAVAHPFRVRRHDSEDGQALVEFALVFPIFILLIVGLIEFSLAFNALLSVNFASRDAALLAAEAGEDSGSDCVILASIDADVQPPASRVRIATVRIYWADSQGNELAANVYTRTGSFNCTMPNNAVVTVPYTLQSGSNYPENERCSVLAGCPEDPGHTELDNIGVSITYSYSWITPLAQIITLGGTGFTLTHANVMRMEPVL
jgi:Flp pilus assembly protein TadG